MANEKPTLTRIVILGAGFGGIRTAQDLARQLPPGLAQITLISRETHHLYTPSLYEVVCGMTPKEVCLPLADCFDDLPVEILVDTVASVRLKDQSILLKSGKKLSYDHLVLALGSVTNFYGIKGLDRFAFPLKTLRDAWLLRQHIDGEFGVAHASSPLVIDRKLRFIIAGAGPTGVELAAALASYTRRLSHQIHVSANKVAIELVEATPQILGRYPVAVGRAVTKRLQSLGVRVVTDNPVREERLQSIVFAAGVEQAETLIWTAGVMSHPLYQTILGLELDKRGAVVVDGTLRIHRQKNVWAVGDSVSMTDAGSAHAAIRHARQVAHNILQTLLEKPLQTYEPTKPVLIMPIGRRDAVAHIGQWTLTGWWLVWLKRLVDLHYFMSILSFSRAWKVWRMHGETCADCRSQLRSMLWDRNHIA